MIDESELTSAGERGAAVDGLADGVKRTVDASGTGSTPAGLASTWPDACGDGEVRCFSPVLYAIDTVVPLISLNQRSSWYPDTHVRSGQLVLWWLNLATLLGWLLSSIFVLSLARLSRGPLTGLIVTEL